MNRLIFPLVAVAFTFFTVLSCAEDNKTDDDSVATQVILPDFDADSAYAFVAEQCAFGPRVPGTEPHRACGDMLVERLRASGADTVYEQCGQTTLYNGRPIALRNIIASFNAKADNRIMLCSHWDSRPYADEEASEAARLKPILGADDGASGVGVLLEMARIMGRQKPEMGVDIMLFDLEDWGAPEWEKSRRDDHGWCLGSQYWAEHTHIPGYRAQYGVLLDMVGGRDSRFCREYFSESNARWVNDKVWAAAAKLQLSERFPDRQGGAITDDHLPVMQSARIPCIDIVAFNSDNDSGFPPYWHTSADNMDNISRATLSDVGRVLVSLVY